MPLATLLTMPPPFFRQIFSADYYFSDTDAYMLALATALLLYAAVDTRHLMTPLDATLAL